jgi:hypothetical protein
VEACQEDACRRVAASRTGAAKHRRRGGSSEAPRRLPPPSSAPRMSRGRFHADAAYRRRRPSRCGAPNEKEAGRLMWDARWVVGPPGEMEEKRSGPMGFPYVLDHARLWVAAIERLDGIPGEVGRTRRRKARVQRAGATRRRMGAAGANWTNTLVGFGGYGLELSLAPRSGLHVAGTRADGKASGTLGQPCPRAVPSHCLPGLWVPPPHSL